VQRRNALDVLAELLSISTKNTDTIDSTLSHTIANHLFSRLGDEELMNRVEASSLFAKLDPAFTLATLVRLVYSADIRLRSAATLAVEAVLSGHANQCHTVFVLLDCLRDLVEEKSRGPQIVEKGKEAATKAGASLDLDRVLRVIPAWASRVQNWVLNFESVILLTGSGFVLASICDLFKAWKIHLTLDCSYNNCVL
jgi:hypothetical protein